MSDGTPDPYVLLGVRPTATAQEIGRAYRRLLRDHHPDTGARPSHRAGPDHPLALDEVRAAYALLRDPAARAEYDRARAERDRAPAAPSSRPRPGPRGTAHVTVVAPPVTVVAPPVTVVAPQGDVPAQPDIRVGPVLWRPAR
jgi:curved DNA-binding protein CbpA